MSVSGPDPYATLGVSPDASHSEITTAYRRAVRACHPDAAHPDRERLAAVIAAYQLLRDPDRRAAYDQRHQPTQPMHQVGTIPFASTAPPPHTSLTYAPAPSATTRRISDAGIPDKPQSTRD
ncbi:MAG: J domain-containing protein [Pseudonocardiales bacterium]|nr:J domain-containing protein [Pseudonocardiales bacterium]